MAGSGAGGRKRGLKVMFGIMLVLFTVAAVRLVYFQVVKHDEYAAAAQEQRTRAITLNPKRGTIYDRNGNVLALSVECKTVYCNPHQITDPETTARVLAKHLSGSYSDYLPKLTSDLFYQNVELKVDVEVAELLADELAERELGGIYYHDDTKRTYPYGDVGGQILGVLNVDGEAQSGIELIYDSILAGEKGSMLMETGAGGTPIAGGAYEIEEPVNGTDIILTIDIDMQRKVEQIVSQGMGEYEAKSASACVVDPKSGEVLAICTAPLPTINDRSTLDVDSLTMGLVHDAVEPGSVFKAISAAIGIENGIFSSNSVFYVEPSVKVGDHYVWDVDGRDQGMYMSVREILRRSSNTGAAILVQDYIGPKLFSKGVEGFGIGVSTGIDLPGEVRGTVKPYTSYTGATPGSMSFGQELSIPMIQIVRAYCAIANRGVPTQLHLLQAEDGKLVDYEPQERIISEGTALELVDMMRTVVEEGTARGTRREGFDIAGKTGTAEQAGENGYSSEDLVSSFCGFANASDPDVVIYVGLNHTAHHSEAAVSLFASIMDEAITSFAIVPEDGEAIQ